MCRTLLHGADDRTALFLNRFKPKHKNKKEKRSEDDKL